MNRSTLSIFLLVTTAAHAQQPPPSDPRVTDPFPEVAPEVLEAAAADPGTMIDMDALLRELEAVDNDIHTFQAQIMWDRRFHLQGDRHIRYGTLVYEVDPSADPGVRPRRTFAVEFAELYIDTIKRTERSQWVFDGQWLIEKNYRDKFYSARRLAREGDDIDPLRLGEGPIPLPIGQRREEILRRYEAEVLPTSDGIAPSADDNPEPEELLEARGLIEFLGDAYQLHLVPREPFRDSDQFRDIRLWYERRSLSPRMALTINRSGDESIVQLINVKTNEPLPEGAISIEKPRKSDGWRIEVDEGRFTAPPPPK